MLDGLDGQVEERKGGSPDSRAKDNGDRGGGDGDGGWEGGQVPQGSGEAYESSSSSGLSLLGSCWA